VIFVPTSEYNLEGDVRDYSLLGADGKRAVTTGLSKAQWYKTSLPRKEMQALMKRSDSPAIRDTLLLFFIMAASLAGGVYWWGSWWCIPCWLVYGIFYGSAMDSRWHECGHGTAFKTAWMNNSVYHIACFCMIRNPHGWRWSHIRHHTDTIIVGRDPEIAAMRPPNLLRLASNLHLIYSALWMLSTDGLV